MNVSVEFDIASNRLRIGSLSLPFEPADEVFAGALRVGNPPAVTLLRPLTFGERFEIAGRAAKAATPVDALCRWVLQASCIEKTETSSVDGRAFEMAALVLAGGHEPGPSFARSLTLLGEAGGWNIDQIEKASCLIVDRVLQAIEPAEADHGWTRLDFNRGASGSVDEERRRLAENLLERVATATDRVVTPEQQGGIRASSNASESITKTLPASNPEENRPENGNGNGAASTPAPDRGSEGSGAGHEQRTRSNADSVAARNAETARWSSDDMRRHHAPELSDPVEKINDPGVLISQPDAGSAGISSARSGSEQTVYESPFELHSAPIYQERESLYGGGNAFPPSPVAPFDVLLEGPVASMLLPRGNEPFEKLAPTVGKSATGAGSGQCIWRADAGRSKHGSRRHRLATGPFATRRS